jgi:hypothetical protein
MDNDNEIIHIQVEDIPNRLSHDGDLRVGNLDLFEVYAGDDLGYYQQATEMLVAVLCSAPPLSDARVERAAKAVFNNRFLELNGESAVEWETEVSEEYKNEFRVVARRILAAADAVPVVEWTTEQPKCEIRIEVDKTVSINLDVGSVVELHGVGVATDGKYTIIKSEGGVIEHGDGFGTVAKPVTRLVLERDPAPIPTPPGGEGR